MSVIYSGTGEEFVIGTGAVAKDYDGHVKAINHRGYRRTGASENTIAAYKASKNAGFNFVETDIRFTSDNVCVLVHDATTGGLAVDTHTYAELLAVNPNLARFDDFVYLCKNILLHPYIEIKAGSQTQLESAFEIVKGAGMLRDCTWISFFTSSLTRVKTIDEYARIGYVSNTATASDVTTALTFKTEYNEVFLDAKLEGVTSEGIEACIANDVPLEVWTVNMQSSILNMDHYITGVTSDTLCAGKILFDSSI